MRKLLLCTLTTVVGLVTAPAVMASPAGVWEGTWATAPQRPSAPFGPSWSVDGFDNQTVRQVVRLSQGGPAVRIHLSNVYGTAPLSVTGATVGRTGASATVDSPRPLTFGHSWSVVIPVGQEVASDAIALPVRPLESVTVTLYFAGKTGQVTHHYDAEATTYRASGDHRADTSGAAFTETSTSWYLLNKVDVVDLSPRRDVVVAFGDSITDGFSAGTDANGTYPQELAERVRGRFGVLNAGIGGNRLLTDSQCLGDKGTSRFKADVLAQPRVRTVLVLEGINDIGFTDFGFDCAKPNLPVTAEQLIAGHRSLIRQAHAAGVRIVGVTLLPFKDAPYYSAAGEQTRDALNAWIRSSGEYDAVVDLDRVMASPSDPDAINPAYDSGDHLHPNAAGYHAMASAVDLHQL